MEEFLAELESSGSLSDVFELVKEAVRKTTGRSRAGLMLGLSELGVGSHGFIGAFYPLDSNIIVVNRTMLDRIVKKKPELYKPYVFHVLLHEYLHSLGLVDEGLTRRRTYEISRQIFGEKHEVTGLAADMGSFLPELIYPEYGWMPQEFPPVELVRDFARSDTTYIA
ncbi:MAG: hypothetical protein JW778_05430 [Candidatus Altiarchaeota archaeon]|nr:hypothetical protein [Candidatus Altiarchaeota archaeon]